jgi:hypothetical protein
MASKYKLSGGTCAWRGCRKTSKGELPRGNRCPASPLAEAAARWIYLPPRARQLSVITSAVCPRIGSLLLRLNLGAANPGERVPKLRLNNSTASLTA